eukprot:TRINITY_DN59228_c0_g1_i1.p1 TRINITY_DN59228_c0_g1~~TRINITY_DN59228_c0_g1_i1.p1  ORF type:complete len:194 (+),score=58.19 TRINITY_DN59228_c0_g1_i1:76-657(+)
MSNDGDENRRRWKVEDDRLLLQRCLGGFTIEAIAASTVFSTSFSLEEIRERWKNILYDEDTAREVTQQLAERPGRIAWTEAEDECLIQEYLRTGGVQFDRLLEKYRSVFHPQRTTASIEAHFYRLKRTGVLARTGGDGDMERESMEGRTSETSSSFQKAQASVIEDTMSKEEKISTAGKHVLLAQLMSEKKTE